MNHSNYTSKLFRAGNILLALILAIRGLPRTWLREEQPVTLESGWPIYDDEIALLDTIKPQLRIFQSGVLAAALISLAIDPSALKFWRRLNDERWTHYQDRTGDPVGWLLNQILRHSGNRDISPRPDYQFFLFQASLAAVMHWLDTRKRNGLSLLKDAPAPVDIPALLEEVRTGKGLRRAPDGFRPKKTLEGRIPQLTGTMITHHLDWDLAVQMAHTACEIEEYACNPRSIHTARLLTGGQTVPAELAAPGALAAMLLSIGRDVLIEDVWGDVFDGRFRHHAEKGSDLAGIIIRTIALHNRVPGDLVGQAALCARIMMAIKSYNRRKTPGEITYFDSIRRARPCFVEQLSDAWWDLPIPQGPHILLPDIKPVIRGADNAQKRAPCQKRRGKGRGRTGRWGERQFEKYHAQCSLPRPGKLIDRTTEQCGYDYQLVTNSTPDWLFEVKVVKPGQDIELTEKQWKMAEVHGENYWLVLVRKQKGTSPAFEFIRNPYKRLPAEMNTQVVLRVMWRIKGRDWASTLSVSADA